MCTECQYGEIVKEFRNPLSAYVYATVCLHFSSLSPAHTEKKKVEGRKEKFIWEIKVEEEVAASAASAAAASAASITSDAVASPDSIHNICCSYISSIYTSATIA
jgi:hypothetical protein